ncbi:MAG: hypothetical protein M3203_16225, partial [Actinomycetota bacterium]|nr:hypothetical protein [Actinomycetota bacterium]
MTPIRDRGTPFVVVSNRRSGGVNHLDQALGVLRQAVPRLVAVDTADPLVDEALRGAAGGTV